MAELLSCGAQYKPMISLVPSKTWLREPIKTRSIAMTSFLLLYIIFYHLLNSIPSFFFWDNVKILWTCHFEYFENAWSYSSIMIVSPCRKSGCPECSNQKMQKMQIINFISNFFLRYYSEISNLLIWEL